MTTTTQPSTHGSTTAMDRLSEMGYELPALTAAPAYEGAVRCGDTLTTSGQLPLREGSLVATGLVGSDVSVVAAQEAARHCGLNVLAQVQHVTGTLEAVERLQKITVFVASAPGFSDQHIVANAASELFTQVLGDTGRHSRSAVGVAGLPLGAAVEVEATFQLASS